MGKSESITSLGDAARMYMPENRDVGEPINSENVRMEMYKRANGITQDLIAYAESNPNENLKDMLDALTVTSGLSRKQHEIFEQVADIIDSNKQSVNKLKHSVDQHMEEFVKEYEYKLAEFGIDKNTDEGKNVVAGVMFFHALTKKFPSSPVYLNAQPLCIELQTMDVEDMRSLHGGGTPNGFYNSNAAFHMYGTYEQAPLIVVNKKRAPWDVYETVKHEKQHYAYDVLRQAREEKSGRTLNRLLTEWKDNLAADDGMFPEIAKANIERADSSIEQIRDYFLERAKNEALTRFNSGDQMEDFGKNETSVDYYLKAWGMENFEKTAGRILGTKGTEVFKDTLKEDIRSFTKYADRLILGAYVLRNGSVDAIQSMLETKDMADWGKEINKIFKGDQKVYVRLGDLFRQLEERTKNASRIGNPLWKEFENIQNAFIYANEEVHIPLRVAAEQLEDRISKLEAELR